MVGVFATGQSGVELDQLDKFITEEVERVKEEGVSEEEFQKARNTKEAEFAKAFGAMHSRAQNLARYHLFYGDANLINTELDRYLAVKREDLQRVAKKYLTAEGRNVLRYPVPAAPAQPRPPAAPHGRPASRANAARPARPAPRFRPLWHRPTRHGPRCGRRSTRR